MLKHRYRTIIAPALLAASVLASLPASAGSDASSTIGSVNKIDQAATIVANKITTKTAVSKAMKKAQDSLTETQRKAVKNAVDALQATQNAITMLDKKDSKKAVEYLEKAIGKVEVVLALSPDLALAPVSISSEVVEIDSDIKTVRKSIRDSIKLLELGRVQDARLIISNLASEIIIHISQLPLGTYPQAIKKAVPLIEKGKLKEAKAVLLLALDTVIVEDRVIPLPIVRAEDYLAQAEKMAEKAKRTKEEEDKLIKLLKSTRTELEFAEVLGYGKSSDYKEFYNQISEISSKTKGGKYGTGFFDKIKKTISKLL